MDVRGPKRAAARRLIQGTVAACAAAALCAPVAGAATVSNLHAPGVAGPATYDDSDGSGTTLTLSGNGTGTVNVADTVAITPAVGGLGEDDTCAAPLPADPTAPPANPAWICELAQAVKVNLGGGNDTLKVLDGLPPAMDIDGGAGVDHLDFSEHSGGVSMTFAADTSDAATATQFESVTGSAAGDAITGDDLGERISGGNGVDVLAGGAGDDTLVGGADGDTLTGGAGNNRLEGGDGGDTLKATSLEGDLLVGGAGVDMIDGGPGNDVIVAELDGSADKINCGDGVDTVTADLGLNGVADDVDPDTCENIRGRVASMPTTTTTETTTPIIVVPSLGTPGIKAVLAPGKANFADLTPPGASMRSFTRQRLKTVAGRGVPVRVSCNEACGISVALSVDSKTARRLKLDKGAGPLVVGTASAKRTTAGTTVLRVKFTKKARAALMRSNRAVTTTTQVLVSDASGNGTLLSRRVTFVR